MNTSPKRRSEANIQPSAEEQAVNERLVEILKANATRADSSEVESARLPKRGFFAQVYAITSLVGLMIVAFIYSKFVDVEA
jgi:hypothetical protein